MDTPCPPGAACAVDKRIRERSPDCVCRRIAEAAAHGDERIIRAIPGAGVRRAVDNSRLPPTRREAGR